jgi:hypothetical protein
MVQHSPCTTRHLTNKKPEDEIYYSQRGKLQMLGVGFTTHTTDTAQTSFILKQTE